MTAKRRTERPFSAEFDLARHVVSERQARDFLVGRGTEPDDRVIRVGPVRIGGRRPVVIAGPCAVDGRRDFLATVEALAVAGVGLVRANLFKFRTLSRDFQGMAAPGLDILREARARFGVRFVTEVLDTTHIDLLRDAVDVFQVGSRSMTNTALLKALGRVDQPVLLKRQYAATLGEYLAAAEYIAQGGNRNIILCERGIRTFEPWMRFTLDVPGIALLRRVSPLPVIADISHSLGRTDIAPPLARAALAAGASGLMVEVHAHPGRARSDASQQLTPAEFTTLMAGLGLAPRRRSK